MRRWSNLCVVLLAGSLCACAGVREVGRDVAGDALSEQDYLLPPAEACVRSEEAAWAFFGYFVQSKSVRERFTDVSALKAGITLDRFEVVDIDHRWSYAEPNKTIDQYPRVTLEMTFRGSGFVMQYQRANFANDDESFQTYGSPGRYFFEYRNECWKLIGHQPMS